VQTAITDQGGGIGKVEWRVNGVTLGIEERVAFGSFSVKLQQASHMI
jgi:hypothetical protein